ncbi:MAG: glycosyltransferase family 87 protein [Chloroflexota bacterium]
MRLDVRTRRLLSTGLTLLCIGGLVMAWIWLNFNERNFMQDARVYWRFDYDQLYGRGTVGGRDAYLYSPAFAQLFFPFGILPWEVFKGMWSAANIAVLAWLVGPRWAALFLLFPGSPVSDEVSTGNLHLLMAAAAVVGFRLPATWAFNLLTKVSPGVGLLWFAGRREWRSLALAVVVTLVVSAASFAIGPHLWFEWIDSLRQNTAVPIPASAVAFTAPLWLRLIVAGVIAFGGGVRGWRWTVPVAMTLALPVPWLSGLSILVAVVALLRRRAPDQPPATHRMRST